MESTKKTGFHSDFLNTAGTISRFEENIYIPPQKNIDAYRTEYIHEYAKSTAVILHIALLSSKNTLDLNISEGNIPQSHRHQ